jgi:hypothetical protein
MKNEIQITSRATLKKEATEKIAKGEVRLRRMIWWKSAIPYSDQSPYGRAVRTQSLKP